MKKIFYIIFAGVCSFIALNTFFYLKIYNDQKEFQTSLLLHQVRICGNTIEQYGLNFENEINYILYSNDITKSFNDPEIKDKGSKSLELFYSKYSRLISKIVILGNQKNVYSLILDKKNTFVSDYYESQQQIPLLDRDKLTIENGNYQFSIPVFRENSVVANISIGIDFLNYIGSVFERYKLENTTWQWLINDKNEVLSTSGNDLKVDSLDLSYITSQIIEGNEGSRIHEMMIDGKKVRMISVFYPARLIRKDFSIVFSINTATFLRSVFLKIIIITIASLLLMSLILFILFRIIQVKSLEARKHELSEQLLRSSFDSLPIGIMIINQDHTIRIINHTARDFLLLTRKEEITGKPVNKILPSDIIDSTDEPYSSTFGEGILFKVNNGFRENLLFRREFQTEIEKNLLRVIVIFDITHFEKLKTRDHVAQNARAGLIRNMSNEIFVPVKTLRDTFDSLKTRKDLSSHNEELLVIEKSIDLLENLIKVLIDFSSIDAGKVVIEDIPFQLRSEINFAIEPLKPAASLKNISIITKVKNEVPEKMNGDPFRLRQAISQVLENSIENTDKGRILLSVDIMEQSVNAVKLKFQIEDTGKVLPVDRLNEFLNSQESDDLIEKGELGSSGFKLAIAKQHIGLMKGQIWLESPSSISTHPDFPGIKYNFIIEIFPDNVYSKNPDFNSVTIVSDIHCLVLSQINDPEDKTIELFEQSGMAIKQRIYRNDSLDSIIQYIRDSQKEFHVLVILDRPDADGFRLASKLYDEKLSGFFVIIMISSRHHPDNIQRSRKFRIDHYLVQPFESYIIPEIIKEHFTAIPVQSFKTIPKGYKINENLSILLAEDNLFNRKVNQTLFKSLGFEVDLAQNGNEVLEMVKEHHYDIIFLDLLMPGLDGFETASRLRELDFRMPIVAITAVETEDARRHAIETGIDRYLVKPATIEDIRKILLDLFSEFA